MTKKIGIREVTRNFSILDEYDYVEIEDKKTHEYKGMFISSKYAKEFKREVTIKDQTNRMILLTAISKPQRLDKYLPYDMPKIYLPDHSEFSKEFIEEILKKYNPTSILTTNKDAVKLKSYNLKLSILELSIMIDSKSLEKIDSYIHLYYQSKISKIKILSKLTS